MVETSKIRVLLVGHRTDVFSSCRRHLEANGCHCEFAECEREVWNVLKQGQFDIVLSVHRGRSTHTESLGALLSGSRSTLFYALPIEKGCWWVPILKAGKECFGAPALRPAEFAEALDEVLEQIKVSFEPSAIAIQTTRHTANRKCNRKPVHVSWPAANAEALQAISVGGLPGHASTGEHGIPPGD
jgi:hypothetical protein